jgi:curli biogenesis system outer membrane secretion channel CsgG
VNRTLASVYSCSLYLPLLILAGCLSHTAKPTELPQAVVAEVHHAFDPAYPRVLLLVEPVKTAGKAEQFKYYGGASCDLYQGPEALFSSSLINALSDSGNFAILDSKNPREDAKRVKARRGEMGPYLIRVAVSGLTNDVEVSEHGVPSASDLGGSFLGKLGSAVLAVPGFWVTQITGLPTSWSNKVTQGVIGFDVSVIDPKTNDVVLSFPAQGTFKSEETEIGERHQGYHSKEQVSSPIESALRAAMNDITGRLLREFSKRT